MCNSYCVIVRRDVFEIIQPEPEVKIKLNGCGVTGYKVLNDEINITVNVNGKEVSLT